MVDVQIIVVAVVAARPVAIAPKNLHLSADGGSSYSSY